jgi:type IV secretory pathway VirB4 component
MTPVELTALFAALDVAVCDNTVPTLPQVVTTMFDPSSDVAGSSRTQLLDDGREVAHALNRLVGGDLGGLFDGPSTVRFDADLPMVSLDLSRVQGSDAKIGLVMTCASSWMEAALQDPGGGQRWVIYDEAWRVLKQPALLARMQSQWKLSRALGIANLMVMHRLSDLVAVGERDSEARNLALGLLADCSTKIIYAQESGEDAKTGESLGLSSTEIDQLASLVRGEGLWRVGERSFVVRHVCTPGELELFDTNQRMAGS